MDRIDIPVEVPAIQYEELTSGTVGELSSEIRNNVPEGEYSRIVASSNL